jgi:hypothetical protein
MTSKATACYQLGYKGKNLVVDTGIEPVTYTMSRCRATSTLIDYKLIRGD